MTLLATGAGAVAAPLLLGVGIVCALGWRAVHGSIALLCSGYLVGHLATAFVTAGWLLLDKPVPGPAIPIAAAIVGGALLLRSIRSWRRERAPGATAIPSSDVTPSRPRSMAAMVASALVVAVCAVYADAFSARNATPIAAGDEGDIWTAKAKVLYESSGDLAGSLQHYVLCPDYPPFNPLVQVLAFASAERLTLTESRVPIEMFAIALLLWLYGACSQRSRPFVAALAVVAFAGSTIEANVATAGADVMSACAVLISVDALLRFFAEREVFWWRIACLALAALLVTKNEGSMLAIAIAVPAAVAEVRARRRGTTPLPGREWLWLLVAGSALSAHMVANQVTGARSALFDPARGGGGFWPRFAAGFFDRLPTVVSFYARRLFEPSVQRLQLLCFFVAVGIEFANGRDARMRGTAWILLATIALATGGFVLVFVGTNADLEWHLVTAADRTMLQLQPLAALGICAVAFPRRANTAAT